MKKIIGIDISNLTFSYCVLIDNNATYGELNQTEQGFLELLAIFERHKIDAIGFESTGVYHKALQKYLIGNGVKPLILSPRSVSLFIKSTKIHGKTDKTDSYGIALYIKNNPDLLSMSFPLRDKFRPLLTSLSQYEKQIRQLENLIHSVKKTDSDYLLSSLQLTADNLKNDRNFLKSLILEDFYSVFPEAKLIKSEIVGVGDMVLLNLIPLISDNFESFTVKQILSYFGIAPVPFQSGSSVNRRSHISIHGDGNLRKVLFLSAVSSIRSNEILKDKFNRLVSNGKPKKVALVAVMAHIVRAVVARYSFHTGRAIKK